MKQAWCQQRCTMQVGQGKDLAHKLLIEKISYANDLTQVCGHANQVTGRKTNLFLTNEVIKGKALDCTLALEKISHSLGYSL